MESSRSAIWRLANNTKEQQVLMAEKPISIEESLNRLEEIVESLESEEINLSDAVSLYEEGMKIAQKCRNELEKAELKVTELQEEDKGRMSEVDFSIDL